MKNIKNLKIRGAAYLIAGGLSLLSLSGCSNEQLEVDSYSVSDLLANDKIADSTQLDELTQKGDLMYDDELSYVEAADKLEDSIDLFMMLSEINLSKSTLTNPLTEEEKKTVLSLSKSDVEYYRNVLVDSENVYTEAEELNIIRYLSFIKNNSYNWIQENGKDISIGLMKVAVKSSLANSLKEDYSSISLSQRRSNNAEPDYGRIKTKSATYDLLDADRSISKVTNYIYDLQMIDKIDPSKEFETYSKSIKYAKEIIATGIVADGDDLETLRSVSDTNKILSK